MEKERSTRIEIVGVDDKQQITAVFAACLMWVFLPLQLIYKGTTHICLPAVSFPDDWHITHSDNHWSNESTMKVYIERILLPYVTKERESWSFYLTILHWWSLTHSQAKGQRIFLSYLFLPDSSFPHVLVDMIFAHHWLHAKPLACHLHMVSPRSAPAYVAFGVEMAPHSHLFITEWMLN